jgi:glyoxylase-like metal-dependent hydrolase (beta-lactamase superfamily II)
MIQQYSENLYSFKIDLPKNPLGWLNCYVIKGVDGGRNLLIDSGFNNPDCLRDLKNGMAELELVPENTDVFFTHAHFDHIGNAASLQQMGCRIMLGRIEYDFFLTAPWVGQIANSAKDGVPEKLKNSLDVRRGMPGKFTVDRLFDEGDVLRYGGYELECILTPGHTPGQLCLYDRARKLMFTGDQVLFDITPNITYMDGFDMLSDYINSLHKIEKFEVELALPGHRTTGDKSFQQRIQELLKHHQVRLDEAQQVVTEFKRACAYQAASRMTWSIRAKSWEDFPDSQKWFATGETLAHLFYLKNLGRLGNEVNSQGLSEYIAK